MEKLGKEEEEWRRRRRSWFLLEEGKVVGEKNGVRIAVAMEMEYKTLA